MASNTLAILLIFLVGLVFFFLLVRYIFKKQVPRPSIDERLRSRRGYSPRGCRAGSRPAGDFDVWTLAYSNAPQWCDQQGNPDVPECNQSDYTWIVHGLWPGYSSSTASSVGCDYPQNCDSSFDVPDYDALAQTYGTGITIGYADPSFIQHEWERHGVCSGLSPDDYFTLIQQVGAQYASQAPNVSRGILNCTLSSDGGVGSCN